MSRLRRTLVISSVLAALLCLPTPVGATADASAAQTASTPAEALREALGRLDALLREEIRRQAGTALSSGAHDLRRLTERRTLLEREAAELGGAEGEALAAKARALAPLIDGLLRARRGGAAPPPPSPWWLAADGLAAARQVNASAHARCAEAVAVGDGLVAGRLVPGGELWLRYRAGAAGAVRASTAGSDFDTVITVYDRCPGAGSPVADNDDGLGLQARAGWRSSRGGEHWIRVTGAGGAAGRVAVELLGGLGALSGFVTDEVSGAPVSFERVLVYEEPGFLPVAVVDTDAGGHYTVDGLPAGTYFVRTQVFVVLDLFDEIYDDIPCTAGCDPTTGTPVPVVAGSETTGIDFALDRGGVIAGRVRAAATGEPLANIDVTIYSEAGFEVDFTSTDPAGRYRFDGLAPGSYFALASSETLYRKELFRELPCDSFCDVTAGEPIPVEVSATTAGVDFTLARLGNIEGRVTDAATGQGIAFHDIEFRRPGLAAGFTTTDSEGYYGSDGQIGGSYFAYTDESDPTYLDQLYDGFPCEPSCNAEAGTPIAVTEGVATRGIDFALDRSGVIAGTVRLADGSFPGPAIVTVYDSSGAFVAEDDVYGNGDYEIAGLVAGDYRVTASCSGFETQLFDALPCPGGPPAGCDPAAGTPVEVIQGAITPDVDFLLARLAEVTSGISGTITAARGGEPLAGLEVEVYDDAGSRVRTTLSRPDGSWVVSDLAAGDHFVTVEGGDLIDEIYDNLPCPGGLPSGCSIAEATPVPVALGQMTSGIDFALDPKGSISGTALDALTGEPVSGGIVVYGEPVGWTFYSGRTGTDGSYTVTGIPGGSYWVELGSSTHVTQLYDGVPCPATGCDVTTGTPVAVTLGQETPGIDFSVEPSGSVSGTVTEEPSGAPLYLGYAQLWGLDGEPGQYVQTDRDGHYVIRGVDPGTYYAVGNAPFHGAEVYPGMPCDGACEPTAGMPIVVEPGGSVTGIDFTVPIASGITGRVTTTEGAPITGVAIDLWDSTLDQRGVAFTDAQGRFWLRPMSGTGTFFVSTDNGAGAVDQVYDSLACPLGSAYEGQCNPTVGTPIELPTYSALVTGIDFELARPPIFGDGFESGDTSAWSAAVE